MAEVNVTKDLANKTLIIKCEIGASRDKVWEAYADKQMFEEWWGPEGWTTNTKEFDFKPEGRVHYEMKCVDKGQGEWFGQSSWGLMVLDEINKPNSFSFKDYFSDEAGNIDKTMPSIITTVEFSEANGKTIIITRAVAETTEQLDDLLKMGVVEGFTGQLNKLESLLG